MQTGIYLRISQDRTGEEAGVNRQREDCLALADQLGWQVAEIYRDNDTSATSGKVREHYQRMLADIAAGRINAIIAWHTDRLYRRLRDLEDLADLCNEHKIMVRTVRAGEFDLSTATGRMLAGILGSVAKGEVEIKSERWKRSFRQRREAGQWMGSGPRTFGYSGLRKGKLEPPGHEQAGEIVPDEARIIREVADLLLNGGGIMAACNKLRADGVTTTRDNPWTPTALRLLLTNPRIAGLVTVKGDILGVGTWEPILDRATWERIRAQLDDREQGNNGSRGNRRSLLSGLAVCGFPDGDDICAKPLVRTTTSVPSYQCRVAGTWSSQHVTVSAERLEEMVEAAAQTVLDDERVRRAITDRLQPGKPDALLAQIEDYERQLAELRESLKAARHTETRNDIITEMDRVRDEIADHRARLVPMPDIPVTGDEWPDDRERRAKLIRLVVARVVVGPAKKRGGPFDTDRVRIDPVL